MNVMKPKILIVDDIPQNLQLLGNALRNKAYQVFFANSGQEALDTVAEINFDLILLDIMMPGMDGYTVCDRLKENDETAGVPIIFLTAKTDTDSIVKGFKRGAVDYISKPFVVEELLARISTHLTIQAEINRRKRTQNKIIAFANEMEQAKVCAEENADQLFDATIELTYAKDELDRANQAKNTLLSIIAHDLRGPVGNIFITLKMLLDEVISPADEKTLLVQLGKAAENTFNLLENLLAWASSQKGQIQYIPKTISLANLCNKAVSYQLASASAKSIDVDIQIPAESEVFADTNLLSTTFRNLLSNAIKFTPENGKINVWIEQNKDVVIVFVQDTGVGISPENINRIFNENEFYTTRGTVMEKGSGLGLKLCRSFINKNGGELIIDSTPGTGSIFSFDIPCTKDNSHVIIL